MGSRSYLWGMDIREQFEANRRLWDKRTGIHLKSDFYHTDRILGGESSLTEIEELYLPSIEGKRLLHLQCHFGLDTISLSRKGASCTGIDFSPEAIRNARELSERAGLDIHFLESNVYDVPKLALPAFDMVFTSYGVLSWLPDLKGWAEVVAGSLKTGGALYLAEFHPILYMFDFDKQTLSYPYHNTGQAFEEWCESSYTGTGEKVGMNSWFWQHSLSETINALIGAGMQIDALHEVPWSPYNCFPGMNEVAASRFYFGPIETQTPHVFVLLARK